MKKAIVICIFLIIIFAFLLGELFVRKFSKTGFYTPKQLRELSLDYEESILARNIFPQRVQKTKGENDADVYVNDKGYRGKDFTVEKPPGVTRIIFYGGSSVFDIAVPEGKDWPHLVEKYLKEKGFTNIEVINAGVPSNSSFESMGRLFAEGYLFQPDYVIISNQWNDIKYFRSNKPLLRQFLTQPHIKKNDPFLNYQNFLDEFLSKNSQLYVRLRTKYFLAVYKPTGEGAEAEGEFTNKIAESALKQYRLNIQMFVDLGRNIKAVPVLMMEPRLVIENNTEEQKTRIKYHSVKLTHEALYDAFLKTDEIIRQVAKEKNAQVLDEVLALSGRDDIFRDQVHTTEKGSEEIAKIVASKFGKMLRKAR